jgi:hypothetical protein
MMDTITKLLDLAEQQARLTLTVLRQDLMPSWVIITGSGEARIIGTPWNNEAEKEATGMYIRAQLRKTNAQAYSFVTEAWMAEAPQDWDPGTPLPDKDRPAERADRKEVVIACATDGQRTQWRQWCIVRDWNEQIRQLEPMEIGSGLTESWISDLLKK